MLNFPCKNLNVEELEVNHKQAISFAEPYILTKLIRNMIVKALSGVRNVGLTSNIRWKEQFPYINNTI